MGGNIRDLGALHQVMRGEITLDKACEGMTDDFEIGHVSHRKDGDYRKVAQGKWVPVSAPKGAGGAKAAGEKKSFTGPGNMAGHKWEAEKVGDKFVVTHTYPDGRTDKTDISKQEYDTMKTNAPEPKNEAPKAPLKRKELIEAIVNSYDDEDRKQRYGAWLKRQPLSELEKIHSARKTLYGKAESQKPEAKANPYQAEQDKFMEVLQESSSKYNDPSKVTVYRTEKGNWDTYYDGHRIGIIGGDKLDSEAADELGWLERSTPDFEEEAKESYRKGLMKNLEGKDEQTRKQMIEYARKQAEKYPDNGSFMEAIREVEESVGQKLEPKAVSEMDASITDWTDKAKLKGHYAPKNNMTFNELYEGMKQGKDVDKMLGITESETRFRILDELAKRTGKSIEELHDLWYKNYIADDTDDAAPGIAGKAVELAQRDYTDVPGRVLTADTKIRLSKIKR